MYFEKPTRNASDFVVWETTRSDNIELLQELVDIFEDRAKKYHELSYKKHRVHLKNLSLMIFQMLAI
jgi:hypothetical protein